MMYADQPTPPFNSPYQQHASRIGALHESPYPSPVRHESLSRHVQGLGIYEAHPLPTGLPPSPQSSEVWPSHFSTGASPLMTEAAIADPYLSGAFEHPVNRSPIPWSAQASPRSSHSSYTNDYAREMSSFSHEGSEHAFSGVKVENPGWTAEVRYTAADGSGEMHGLRASRHQPLTVSPERLSTNMYTYDTAYTSPSLARYDPTPVYDYSNRDYARGPSEERAPSPRSGGFRSTKDSVTPGARERTRNRRHTDPDRAAYRCVLCPDKGFARRYNYSQHMLIHDPSRKKQNICPYQDCRKAFVRKTDLARHDQCVHQKMKAHLCSMCNGAFARKDTLRRHEEDGCPRRNHIPPQQRHDSFSNALPKPQL